MDKISTVTVQQCVDVAVRDDLVWVIDAIFRLPEFGTGNVGHFPTLVVDDLPPLLFRSSLSFGGARRKSTDSLDARVPLHHVARRIN